MIYGIIAGIAILIALAVQIDYVFGLVVAILIFCGMIGLGIYANVADDPFGEKRKAAEEFAKLMPEQQKRRQEVYAAVLKELQKKK